MEVPSTLFKRSVSNMFSVLSFIMISDPVAASLSILTIIDVSLLKLIEITFDLYSLLKKLIV